ncbi:MAG: alpha/beta hydrolase-fold protein [Saprospiraceae bacterium]
MKHFLLLCLCLPIFAIGQGTVINDAINSPALDNSSQAVDVYLPPNYDAADPNTRYPVIYFLHGANGDQGSYPFITGILDNLISSGTIHPVIMVKPTGDQGLYGSSFYANSPVNGNVEDYIIQDVIAHVDSAYNTIATPEKRTIMGHSMGGIGSMRLGLKYYQMFRGVASHSGPVDANGLQYVVPDILSESGGSAPYNYSPFNGVFSGLTHAIAGAYSPNPSKPFLFVDYPLDDQGAIIDSVHQKWLAENPFRYAEKVPASADFAVYFDCGLQDELKIYNMTQSFSDSLNLINYPHIYETYNGTHTNQLAARFPIAIQFLDSIMNPFAVNVANLEVQNELTFNTYPNPVIDHLNIEYELNNKDLVQVTIFDGIGQTVATLVNKQQSEGIHQIQWNDFKNHPKGMYWIRLQVGEQVVTKPIILSSN